MPDVRADEAVANMEILTQQNAALSAVAQHCQMQRTTPVRQTACPR
jgi:hypothetical protein